MKCTVCSKPITKRANGCVRCEKHGRLHQMRVDAKRSEKCVPSYEKLEDMIPVDMSCPDCGKVMLWKSKNERHRVASLQHYRDGSLAIVCFSCNSRHRDMPGDSYREMPKGHKFCPRCQQCKPRETGFYADRSHSGPLKTKSYCKTCDNEKFAVWQSRNREKINEGARRRYRARRKATGARLLTETNGELPQ